MGPSWRGREEGRQSVAEIQDVLLNQIAHRPPSAGKQRRRRKRSSLEIGRVSDKQSISSVRSSLSRLSNAIDVASRASCLLWPVHGDTISRGMNCVAPVSGAG